MSRLLVLTALLVLASSSVFAQGATTISSVNVLTQVDRVRGAFTSISYTVPADAEEIHVRLLMPTNDYEDTRNEVTVTIYAFLDGAWWLGPSGTWVGGARVGKDGTINPSTFLGVNTYTPMGGQNGQPLDLRGANVRVEVEVWRAMRLGAAIAGSKP